MDIKDLVARLAAIRVLRVAAIGAVGVVVQTILFDTLGVYWHVVSPSTATVIGGEVGVLIGFVLNNRYSFGDRAHGHVLARMARFHLIVAGSLAIQWACVFAAEHMTTSLLVLHAAYVVGILTGFVWNYTLYHLWVWRHPSPR